MQTNNEISADDFNTFFSSIAGNIVNTIATVDKTPSDYLTNHVMPEGISLYNLEPVTQAEIRDIIKNLNNSHAKDMYGLSNSLVKYIMEAILDPLVYLINQCLYSGIFPDCLKCSKVTPLHKKVT